MNLSRSTTSDWRRLAGVLLIVTLIISGCRPGARSQPDQLSGAVLLWHDLGEEDSLVLDQVLANFMDIHPDLRVTATAIPEELLRQRFEGAVDSGLGPDLLLGPSSWIKVLADSGRIQPIDAFVEPQFWEQYIPAAVTATEYDDQHYAIPESLRMMGLYYNKQFVDTPATTLDELMAQVEQGANIGMSPTFVDLFWGIRAFGGDLLDENGQIVLNRGGFANWLAWLITAQDAPNFLMDRNRETLRTLFGDGELAYLIDGSWAVRELENAIGRDRLGVAALPAGPIGAASPLLETNAFMLSVASSQRQSQAAIDLARFITNPEQTTTLMRRGNRIPATDLIQVSPSVDPIAFPFVTQARNAIPYRNSETMDVVIEVGSGAYNKALQGVQEPVEVANSITRAINQALGIATEESAAPVCQQLGVLDFWYVESETDQRTLRTIIDQFSETCPYIVVRATGHDAADLQALLTADSTRKPDIALIPSTWLALLSQGGSVRSLTGMISAETLQAYQPAAVQSWVVDERLYGVPFTLDLPGLFYNRSLVTDPARTLHDLVTEGTAARPTAVDITFDQAYWGLPAFGGRLFDDELRAIMDHGGMADWLFWLQEARDKAGMVLGEDERRLREQFLSGQVSYLVGGANGLASIEAGLGKENVGVTRLPTGPVADAAPLLTTQGFVIPTSVIDDTSAEALLFIQEATGLQSQQQLMETARKVPVRVGVDYSADPAIASFLERASSAIVRPNTSQMVTAQKLGAALYAPLLSGSTLSAADWEALVAEVTEEINVENGFAPTPAADETAEPEATAPPSATPVNEKSKGPISNRLP